MDLYKNWLRSNGIKFEDIPIGISFKYQGCNFLIADPGRDSQFLSVSLPGIDSVDGNELQVLKACNKVTGETKVLKVVLHGDSVWAHVEIFIDNTPDIEDFMDRVLDLLMEGRQRYYIALRGL